MAKHPTSHATIRVIKTRCSDRSDRLEYTRYLRESFSLVSTRFDLSSLRILGTVGEPINPEAWQWYHEAVGQGRCPMVDTFWQTETVSAGHKPQLVPAFTKTGWPFGVASICVYPLTPETLASIVLPITNIIVGTESFHAQILTDGAR